KDGKKTVTGSLGDAAKLTAVIKSNDWNEYVIVAQGNKLAHTINGVPMIEVVDEQVDKRAMEGILALQLHRGQGQMVVQFKDIRLKKLPPAKPAGAPALHLNQFVYTQPQPPA